MLPLQPLPGAQRLLQVPQFFGSLRTSVQFP